MRKNSIAGSSSTARPRANTISHIDQAALGIGATTAPSPVAPHHAATAAAHAYPATMSSSMGSHLDYRGFGVSQAGHQHQHHPPHLNGLAKLDTTGLPIDLSGGLRTAPVYGSFDANFSDMLMGHGSTINPAQLHFGGSPQAFGDDSSSPFTPGPHQMHQHQHPPTDPMMEDEFSFDWMMNGLDPSLPLGNGTDSAVDESSPSAMSTGSQSGISEAMMDGPHRLSLSSSGWHNPFTTHASAPSTHPFAFDYPALNDFGIPPDTVSPKSLMAQNNPFAETYATPPSMTSVGQPMLGGHSQSMFPSSMATNGESPNPLNLPFANSALRNPHSSSSTDTFTDSTRQTLLASMARPSGFNHRKYSQSTTLNGRLQGRDLFSSSSPSSRFSTTGFNSSGLLPSTPDMQRYISSYIVYFHHHVPFLHIPTLNFQAPEYTSKLTSAGIAGGGGCLILSMAAIGALYEFDTAASKELFEAAKKMIQLYLEERRKADMSAALNRGNPARENSVHNTPLWLVQAMLLNVIYGHTCGDKTSADIASTHCAALVSLARAAELTHHLDPEHLPQDHLYPGPGERDAESGGVSFKFGPPKERKEWLDWKIVEERKRTLYCIFVLSSFVVSAYNHAPALTNSEVQLDLPCEEGLWAAESPQAWKQMGGPQSNKKGLSFSSALTTLLTASQREQPSSISSLQFVPNASLVGDVPSSDLKPSTFGCLVLIYALHNYIWETRQRHLGRQWTSRETDAMQAHIEPALRAWQAAWASNPVHSLERPNPYGAGPLSADAIPLLDLAYVRLFVNLGRCKEAFWHRDWNAISDELARGTAILNHVDEITPDVLDPSITSSSEGIVGDVGNQRRESVTDLGVGDLSISTTPTQDQPMHTLAGVYRPDQSKREKLLRKAAFYAADSISMSNRLGNTYSEFTSRELPIQCAMCIFDCSQVLAEWITTVQERVGPYMGVLGRDEIDMTQVPGILLLEDEDCKLIEKVKEILSTVEAKMQQTVQNSTTVSAMSALQRLPSVVEGGYGPKTLVAASTLLDRAGVWPVTKLMARSLESQAVRLKERAEASSMGRH